MFRLRLSEAKNNLLNPQKYRQVNPLNLLFIELPKVETHYHI